MQQLDEVVSLYLKMETNHALLITGEWGVGKTYYFKHTLKKKISAIPTFNDATRKYIPVTISLFGLKTIEEIQSAIFQELYPILKNNKFKLGTTLLKAIAKGIMLLKGIGDYGKYVEEIKVKKETLLNLNEIVICFDDLERISPSLQLEELIGYINSLVESENVKVLIIANEGKIPPGNYSALKEKTIGNTIEFVTELDEMFDKIIHDKYLSFKSYQTFLKINKQAIINTFKNKSTNLRILIFSLSYFQEIFSQVVTNITKENILYNRLDEVFNSTLVFTLAVAIEYKEGNLSYKKRRDLENHSFNFDDYIGKMTNSVKVLDKNEENYRATFIETYFKDSQYFFYKSIFNYLTGGTAFKFNDLLKELKKKYHIEENKIEPQYETLTLLRYSNFYQLNDKEYKVHTRELLNYATSGKYTIGEYLTIFYLITRFKNPLNLNLIQLKDHLLNGMKKSKKTSEYDPHLESHLSLPYNAEHLVLLKEIFSITLKLNDEILKEQQKIKYKELEDLFYENFEKFYEKVFNKNSSLNYEPFLSKFNANKFYSYFSNSNNSKRIQILNFIRDRYDKHLNSGHLSERKFLEELKKRVEKKNQLLEGKNISGDTFLRFNNYLEDTLNKLNGLV